MALRLCRKGIAAGPRLVGEEDHEVMIIVRRVDTSRCDADHYENSYARSAAQRARGPLFSGAARTKETRQAEAAAGLSSLRDSRLYPRAR